MSKPKGFRYSEQEREELLERYRQSGLGVTRFCKEAGVSYGALKRWLEDSGEDGGSEASAGLVELTVEEPGREQWLSARLPNGIVAQVRLDAPRDEVMDWIRELARC